MIRYRIDYPNGSQYFDDEQTALTFYNETPGANYPISVDFTNVKPKLDEKYCTIACWRIRAITKVMGLDGAIDTVINSLEEPTKTIVQFAWYQGSTIERYSVTVKSIGVALNLTESEIDQIFIDAYNINV